MGIYCVGIKNTERAIGTKNDAKSLDHFLDTLKTLILNYRTELLAMGVTVTSERIIEF